MHEYIKLKNDHRHFKCTTTDCMYYIILYYIVGLDWIGLVYSSGCFSSSFVSKQYNLKGNSESIRHTGQDWSPRMSFILKGSQISTLQLKCWCKSKTSIQKYRKANTRLILNLCMNHMVYVLSTMWTIKNQPSNSTSRSDNSLCLWFLWREDYIEDFKWCLRFQIRVAFWRVCLREVYIEGPNRVWRALRTSILNTDQTLTLSYWNFVCKSYKDLGFHHIVSGRWSKASTEVLYQERWTFSWVNMYVVYASTLSIL